jgi:CHAT domain-containing protein
MSLVKIVTVFFLVFILVFPSLAQDSLNTLSYDKKREKKIELLKYKVMHGEYEEAIQLSETYFTSFKKKKTAHASEFVLLKMLAAQAEFSTFDFDRANTKIQEATTIYQQENAPTEKDKIFSLLHLAEYYNYTGYYFLSNKYSNKADSLSAKFGNAKIQAEVDLVKAHTLTGLQFYKEAEELLNKQYEYRSKSASTKAVPEVDKLYINNSLDYQARKERYADLVNQKIKINILINNNQEAEKLLAEHKNWIRTNLKEGSEFYRDLLVLEAIRFTDNVKYNAAAYSFQQAYSGYAAPEHELSKITNLTNTVEAYFRSGDYVHSQNYLRRLQMFASQNVGKNDPFQLVYGYAMALNLYLEGYSEEAIARLETLQKSFDKLPAYHVYSILLKELQLEIFQKNNNLVGSDKLENEIVTILATYYGTNTPAYHKRLLNIAIREIHYGKRFKYAEDIFKNSYDKYLKSKLARNSKENMEYMTYYAELYLKTDRFDSATSKSREVARIASNVYGQASVDYLLALATFSEYSVLAGRYQEGLDSLKKVTGLGDVKNGNIEKRQKSFLIQSRINKLFGEYDKSKSLINKAYNLSRNSTYDLDIVLQSESSVQLIELYIQTGNYFKAEKNLHSSVEVIKEKLGIGSPKLIPLYFGYIRYNLITGNYKQSDSYLSSVQQLIDSIFGSSSLLKSEYYLLAGDYYLEIKDFKKAEDAYKKADNIQRTILGKNHLKRAEVLLRQANLFSYLPAYKTADIGKIYKDALEIVKVDIGVVNPLYAEIEQNYAEYLISTAAYDQADKLLEEAGKFWVTRLGNENNYSADISLLRGNIAYEKSKYDEAEKNYLKARNAYLNIFNDKHSDYLKAIGKLARTYYMKKQPEKALQAMEEVIPKYLVYTLEYFPSLSFRQKSRYWNNLKEEFEFYTSIALAKSNPGREKYIDKVYNNILTTKGLLLSSSIKLLSKVLHSNDSTLISLYNQWVSEKEFFIGVLSLSKQQQEEQGVDLQELQSDIEHLEKQMSQRSEIFSKEETGKQAVWQDVQKALKPGEYAMEIIRYRHFNKIMTDSILYASLIINSETKDNPSLVILPNGSQMEKRNLKYYRNVSTLFMKDEFSYNAYWKPIKRMIPDGAQIYISGDGVYNQINLEMLPDSTGTFVIDKNQLVLVTNTKDIINSASVMVKKKNKEVKKSANANPYVLCGSPEFYTENQKIKKTIPDLPGAEKEIIDLNLLLASSDKNILKLIKNDMTEDTIKHIPNPKVLHIATHGYFKESDLKSSGDDDIATDPLLNSGLMLLGSGDIIDNPDNKYVNQKDGILTAYEAMDLSLDNTDLVVLSACETGRGEVQIGEGVYGLQRAFLVAGSKAVILSLFKVNDDVTQKLMLSFYQKWLKTGNKRQAFIDAKKEIKAQYKEPIYWGAFIMIEGKL